MRRLVLACVATSAAAALLAGCGGGANTLPAAPPPAPTTSAPPPTVATVTAVVSPTKATQQTLPTLTSGNGQSVSGTLTIPQVASGAANASVTVTVSGAAPTSVPALQSAGRAPLSGRGERSLSGAQPLVFLTLTTSTQIVLQAPPDFSFALGGANASSQYFIAEYDSSRGSWNRALYLASLSPSGAIVDANPGGEFTLRAGQSVVFCLYSMPLVSQISQLHVLTSDYFGPIAASADVHGSTAFTASQVASSLSWAEVPPSAQPAAESAGIKTLLYTSPIRQATNGPLYTSDDSTFAHDCKGNRIIDTAYTNPQVYIMQPGTALATLWKSYVASIFATNNYDAVYEDAAGPLVADYNVLPCNYTDATWDSADAQMEQQLGYPVVASALAAFEETNGSWNPSPGLALASSAVGGSEESCYSSNANASTLKESNSLWLAAESTELTLAQQKKLFFCYPRNTTAASQALDIRNYVLASFLLTYDPSTSVLWEIFATPSSYHVEPETTLVALNPTIDQPSSVSALLVGSGVYAREYQSCYVGGKFVGACAAVVNSDTEAHAYPFGTKYRSSLVLAGGGILDGGSVSTNGPIPSGLGAQTGLVLIQ